MRHVAGPRAPAPAGDGAGAWFRPGTSEAIPARISSVTTHRAALSVSGEISGSPPATDRRPTMALLAHISGGSVRYSSVTGESRTDILVGSEPRSMITRYPTR